MEYPDPSTLSSSSASLSASSVTPAADISSVCSGSGDSFSEPSLLLPHLRAPRPSDLARKRAVHRNPPPTGKRRSRGRGANIIAVKKMNMMQYNWNTLAWHCDGMHDTPERLPASHYGVRNYSPEMLPAWHYGARHDTPYKYAGNMQGFKNMNNRMWMLK